ncbi:MAG: hypothetical protein RBU37_27230, partial [Myxococcota bacterium]|nr:hypothetical protein [Myxococcota bacterium]
MSQFRTTPAGGLVAQRSLQRSPGMVSILAAFTLAFPIGCSSGVRELELGALPDSSELEAMSVSDLLNDEATDEPTLEESAPCDDSSLRSDPKNCGACGYACAEHVPCVEGRCGDVVQLSVGITMTCARLSTGQVLCWLRSADGIARPALIEGLSDAVELDTDGSLGCVRRASGKVACWGDYDFGSFSSSPFTLVATAIKGIDDAIGLAVGSNHACALRADATVACWGKNTLGQLGNATGHSSTGVVYAVETLQGVVQLAAGGAHTCARLDTGAVRCWGSNSEGQLGDNTTEQRSQPVEVSGVLDAVDLVLGEHHSCVRLRSGQVSCWGGGPTLGLGREPQPVTPVPGFAGASAIAAGYQHTCALHDTGRVSCIGTNQEGEFGVEKPDSSAVPVDVPELFDVVELSAGFLQTCARLLDGRVECWGTGRTQGGDGSAVPVQVDGLSEITELAVAGWASCARPSTGPWRCWGGNYKGQLGVVG